MMNRCLICHEIINPIISWRTIFSAAKEQLLCSTCEKSLVKINGETCRICSRPFHALDDKFRCGDLCNDCVRWEADPEWHGYLQQNHSIFHYNDFLKEVIAKYKYRGDYILAKVFAEFFKEELQKTKTDFFVPIPLSDERLYERGFNQAEAILTEAGLTPVAMLTRVHSEKQSKKSRSERIHLPQVFQLSSDIDLHGKKIVLVDDIYTTGSTLRHAAKLLKGEGADYIESLTLAR